MNSEAKKMPEQNPQGYGPKKPEILDFARRAEIPMQQTVLEDGTKVVAFQTRLEDFYFMGIENVVNEHSDFGDIWRNFFDKGGFEPLYPYAIDPNSVTISYNRSTNERIYFQGTFVREDAVVPDGYTLKSFPGGDYLVVTTDWMSTYEETMAHIKFAYFKNTAAPDGYEKCTDKEIGIYLMERWGAKTEKGYRYEFWVPIKHV